MPILISFCFHFWTCKLAVYFVYKKFLDLENKGKSENTFQEIFMVFFWKKKFSLYKMNINWVRELYKIDATI